MNSYLDQDTLHPKGDGYLEPGIKIREHIAIEFMKAMIINPELLQAVTSQQIKDNSAAQICAKKAVEWADILRKELRK